MPLFEHIDAPSAFSSVPGFLPRTRSGTLPEPKGQPQLVDPKSATLPPSGGSAEGTILACSTLVAGNDEQKSKPHGLATVELNAGEDGMFRVKIKLESGMEVQRSESKPPSETQLPKPEGQLQLLEPEPQPAASEVVTKRTLQAEPAPCELEPCAAATLCGQFLVQESAPADHHFVQEDDGAQMTKSAMKRAAKEWDWLQAGLPSGVSVIVYEDRMDLLRAMVEGPKGTPYEGGIFAFDLKLPHNYPESCPKAFYHSAGRYANPNLYACGKVCLSLLGTWGGPGWDSSVSTLLQLLVSIQGLVLIEDPYCNEPGQETDGGTEMSVAYNQQVQADVIHVMTKTAKSPLVGTEEIMMGFIAREGRGLLRRAALLANPRVTVRALEELDKAIGHPFGVAVQGKTLPKQPEQQLSRDLCMLECYRQSTEKNAARASDLMLVELLYGVVPRWLKIREAFTSGYARGTDSEDDY